VSKSTTSEVKSACDFWDVSQAANYLASQACTLSGRHIQDGVLRSSFNREVAYYARGIVRDVEAGRKTPDEGLAALLKEKRHLIKQSREIALKGIGVAAGSLQIATGAGICYGSVGLLCPFFGVPLMAHGANNVYENGRNLMQGRSDTQGPVRKAYQGVSKAFGQSDVEANIAYGAVDVSTSIYGLGRLLLKRDAWRLFRYIRADYVRVYSQTSVPALTFEAISNGITLKSTHDEFEKHGR
jgi:hypothetical protein